VKTRNSRTETKPGIRTVVMTTLFIGSAKTPLAKRAGSVSGGNSVLMFSHRAPEHNKIKVQRQPSISF
jgi:hypothetical protein